MSDENFDRFKKCAVEVLSVEPDQVVPEATPDEEWTWAVESPKACDEHAQRLGVRIGVEPINRFETFFINRAAQAIALAEAVGPTCGVVLDSFHMAMEESDFHEAIRAAGLKPFGSSTLNNIVPVSFTVKGSAINLLATFPPFFPFKYLLV